MNETLTFEQALSKLEEIVKELESGEAPLDESMKLFEEGVGMVRACTEMLETAEKKVKKLTEKDGKTVEEDMEPMGAAAE